MFLKHDIKSALNGSYLVSQKVRSVCFEDQSFQWNFLSHLVKVPRFGSCHQGSQSNLALWVISQPSFAFCPGVVEAMNVDFVIVWNVSLQLSK